MRAALALWVLAAVAACKEKPEQAPTAPATPAATPDRGPAPALPGEAAEGAPAESEPIERREVKPISVHDAAAALPAIDGREVIGLKQTSDESQVHGTWCIAGASADDVAKQLGQTLAQAKYGNISIRGDARKAGVAADRDGLRVSLVVSASSAAVCQAPAHYFASATVFRL
jgi:hypothetical protein